MQCLFCGATPANGATLYRVNAKGQPGVWACEKHIKNTDAAVDPVVANVIEAIQSK